jgi:hypothetical protein
VFRQAPRTLLKRSWRESGDFLHDLEAFLGAELGPIGEALRADQRRAAGVEIAVLAGEVAAVGEVPGNDVGPGEPFDSAQGRPFDGLRAGGLVSGCGMFISICRARRASHAEEVAGRGEDVLVQFEGICASLWAQSGEFLGGAGLQHARTG